MIVETCSAVLDVEDMKLVQVSREFLALVKGIAAIDKDQYPETLGKLFIINVPSIFPIVWRSVQFFLDPAIAAKIEIFGAKKDWLPVLSAQIGLENMPACYGGLLPALSTDVHPYAHSMKDYNSMKVDENGDGNKNMTGSTDIEGMTQEDIETIQPLDDIDMYIREGRLATELLRQQAQSPKTPGSSVSGSGSENWNILSIRKLFSGALTPIRSGGREWERERERYMDIGCAEVDGHDGAGNAIKDDPALVDIDEEKGDAGSRPGGSERTEGGDVEGWNKDDNNVRDVESSPQSRRLPVRTNASPERLRPVGYRREDGRFAARTNTYCVCTCYSSFCNRPIVAMAAAFFSALYRVVTFQRWVGKKSLKQVRRYLFYAISAYLIAALTAMILSAYLVSMTLWVSSVALYVHLWTGVVVLLVSVVMMAINLAAYIGCYYQNRALLIMYSSILAFGAFMYFAVALASFLYATLPAVNSFGNGSNEDFRDKNSGLFHHIERNKCYVSTVFSFFCRFLLPDYITLSLSLPTPSLSHTDTHDPWYITVTSAAFISDSILSFLTRPFFFIYYSSLHFTSSHSNLQSIFKDSCRTLSSSSSSSSPYLLPLLFLLLPPHFPLPPFIFFLSIDFFFFSFSMVVFIFDFIFHTIFFFSFSFTLFNSSSSSSTSSS